MFDCFKLKVEMVDNKIGKCDLAKGHLRLHLCKEGWIQKTRVIYYLSATSGSRYFSPRGN